MCIHVVVHIFVVKCILDIVILQVLVRRYVAIFHPNQIRITYHKVSQHPSEGVQEFRHVQCSMGIYTL